MSWERSNIQFPLWRKKVDGSLFQYRVTTIPNHYVREWGFEKLFGNVFSKKDPKSHVAIYFHEGSKKVKCKGYLTVAEKKRT